LSQQQFGCDMALPNMQSQAGWSPRSPAISKLIGICLWYYFPHRFLDTRKEHVDHRKKPLAILIHWILGYPIVRPSSPTSLANQTPFFDGLKTGSSSHTTCLCLVWEYIFQSSFKTLDSVFYIAQRLAQGFYRENEIPWKVRKPIIDRETCSDFATTPQRPLHRWLFISKIQVIALETCVPKLPVVFEIGNQDEWSTVYCFCPHRFYTYIYIIIIYILYIYTQRERDSQLMTMCQNVHKVFTSVVLSPGYIRLSLSQLTQVAFAFWALSWAAWSCAGRGMWQLRWASLCGEWR
jgi:hypothetical protein